MQKVTVKDTELIVVTGFSSQQAQKLSHSTGKIVVILPDGGELDTVDRETAKTILDGIIRSEDINS